MTKFIYHYQQERAQSFTQLPNFLFEAPTYQPLSNEAKLLYAFILRRADLSRKNGWADEYGRIYLYYPICEVVGPASLWAAKGGQHPAGITVCRADRHQETRLWKTQPHLPKIL